MVQPLVDDFCDAYRELFPDGAKIEDVLWVRCERSPYACGDYVRILPQGRRLNEVEALLWRECEKGNCWMYARTFPRGQHIEVARARAEEEERIDQRRRDAAAASRAALWSGPLISCELVLPRLASSKSVTVKLADEILKPKTVQPLTYEIPAAERAVEVCYEQRVSSFDSVKSCVDTILDPGANRVPLSGVKITVPPRYTGMCKLDEILVITPENDQLHVMPGRHSLACSLYGGAHADHRSASVAHYSSPDVRVEFDAPPMGGSVMVRYDIDGGAVRGQAVVRSGW